MRWSFICLLTFPFMTGCRQHPVTDIHSLVAAEESFIRMAKEKNTRDAFLHFLADDAITSPPAKGPVRGKERLKQQQPDESWLSWKPGFSDIASSGNFGYNAGPWEFRSKRTDRDPIAHGHFVSVWKKDARGEWKVALDMGISHEPPTKIHQFKTSNVKSRPSPSDTGELFENERSLIENIHQRDGYTYDTLLSNEAQFFRPGRQPVSSKEARDLLANYAAFVYTFAGGEISDSGDMGFVYGKAVMQTTGSIHGYLRIWKRENGRWKIVVDLISG